MTYSPKDRLTVYYSEWAEPLPYNPVSSRSRLIPGQQDLLSEENLSFNSRLV